MYPAKQCRELADFSLAELVLEPGFVGCDRAAGLRQCGAPFGRQRQIRSYQIIDLSAGLDFGKFSLDAYVKNLGNSAGRTSTTGTTVFGAFPIYPNGAIGTGVIRPRTIGLSLTAGL